MLGSQDKDSIKLILLVERFINIYYFQGVMAKRKKTKRKAKKQDSGSNGLILALVVGLILLGLFIYS